MPTPTWPFNNTDLHNIYDAIVAGGGGGDTLAGQLLDGTVEPSNLAGFYPEAINGSYNFLNTISSRTVNTNDLLNGEADPSNTATGFYPSYFENINNQIQALNGLFQGYGDPIAPGGFYPDHVAQDTGSLLKIEQHTDLSSATQTAQTYFGDGFLVNNQSASGFSNPQAAAAAAAAFMNAQTGTNLIVNLTFTDHGGVAGAAYTLIFKTLI
jgi:hypothetical protein